MKILYNSLVYLFIAVMFISCYDEENLNVPLDKVTYDIKDSEDPLDHKVYEIYKNYHSIVRYDYDTVEYEWNMVKSLLADDNSLKIVQQEDRDVLLKGAKFVEEVFFKVYEGKLDKRWMPFKVLLSEKIDEENEWVGMLYDLPAYSGLNYLMVGNIKEGVDELSPEEKQRAKEAIHGRYWGHYLYGNERISIPDEFFAISQGKYEDSTEDPNADGFWYLNQVFLSWGDYCPDMDQDVQQFFGKIVSTPYSELEPILEANDRLRYKYEILVTYIKVVFGIDLQAIGNGN